MTHTDFRVLALALPGAEEKAHFGKADFRVRNRIFASLPDEAHGVLKLTREQQELLAAAEPGIFQPVNGGWGVKGWTVVLLAAADEAAVRSGLATAWRNVAPKSLADQRVGTGFSPR